MTPTAEQIFTQLVAMFPDFAVFSEEDDDFWKSNHISFRLHGLFALFSWYVRDNFLQMPEAKQKELMDFIESCVEADDDNALDNAACTCFLENLSSEPPLSAPLRRFMGPKSLQFFVLWDFPEPPPATPST